MKGLKSITFYNTGRFAYGHIDVDENSLLTGTNGVGKTTTSQAMLFFYGTTRSDQLGIARREGKTSWSKYMYPHSNSYIFYHYTGLYGNILLMTYQHGNGVAWRFMLVEGSIDLNSIVLENQIVKNPKEVLKDFLIADYKPSALITDSGVYRKILYGNIDTRREKDLSAFREYSLMETVGEYRHIPDMQSSIFVDSSVKAGAIEKAITSGYGASAKLSLPQIRNQLQGAIEQFRAVRNYEQQKRLIEKMSEEVHDYTRHTDAIERALRQMLSNKKALILKKEEAVLTKQKLDIDYGVMQNRQRQEQSELDAHVDVLKADYVTVKLEFEEAQRLQIYYADKDMLSASAEVDAIPTLEKELNQKKIEYEDSLGGAKSLAQTYDAMLLVEQEGLVNQIRLHEQEYESFKKENEFQRELLEQRHDLELEQIDKSHEKKNEKLVIDLANAELMYMQAYKKHTNIEFANPYNAPVIELKEAIFDLRTAIAKTNDDRELLKRQIASNALHRDRLEQRIETIGSDTTRRIEIEKKPFLESIKTLEDLLEADEKTLLHLIRTQLPVREGILTSILKDEILLNTELSPRVGEVHSSIYGLILDETVLPQSNLSRETLLEKISAEKKAILAIVKKITDESDAILATINKEKSELQKEYFSLKSKKDGLDTDLLRDNVKLVLLEEEYEALIKTSQIQWENAKESSKNAYAAAKALLEQLKIQNNRAETLLREEINQCKIIYKDSLTQLRKDLTSAKESLESIIATDNKKSAQNRIDIEQRRKNALLAGGYSVELIETLRNEFEASQKRLEMAKSYRSEVERWRENLEKIRRITSLKERVDTLALSVHDAQNKRSYRNEEMRKEERAFYEKINSLTLSIDSSDMYIKEADIVWNKNDFHFFTQKIDDEGEATHLPMPSEETTSNLGNNASIEYQRRSEAGRTVSTLFGRFLSYFKGSDQFIFFQYNTSSSDDTIRSAKNLIEFVGGGGLDEIKETVASQIRLIQGNITEQYESFSSETRTIETLVNRIDKGLKQAIVNIPVINDIGVRMVRNEHRIFKDLEAIAAVEIPYGKSNSLFGDLEHSNKASSEILGHFETLLNHINDERREELSIADTFDVQFRVVENDNVFDWASSRSGIGSTGTSIIIKTLTYISLLQSVMAGTQRGERIPVHVVLDEIGMLDQQNMRQIINFANENGIYLLNAAPDVKVPDRYKNIYLYRIVNNKSKISKLAVHK